MLLKNNSFVGQNVLDGNELKAIVIEKNQKYELLKVERVKKKQRKEQTKIDRLHEIAIKINDIIDSNIDFTKYGWVQKVSEILKISPQKTRKWIQRNYPELLECAFIKKCA